jgi:hypothetical protein
MKNKILVYDDHCPLCQWYSGLFVKYGLLKLGAPLIGTEVELVLKSRWVVPSRICQSGFLFKYPQLPEALQHIISKVPRKQYHLF